MTSGRFATASRLTARTLLVLGIAAASVVGCAPEPAPTPTPTPAFASEEDAFAAAEEVYRAYNDALNAERSADPSTDPRQYLVGSALEEELAAKRFYQDSELQLVGDVTFVNFEGQRAEIRADSARVEARVCLDVSGTAVVSNDGADVTPAERPARVLLLVTFVGAPPHLSITASELVEGGTC